MPEKEQPVYGEPRVIQDEDGIVITARTRTDRYGTRIIVSSPQLAEILKLTDPLDKPEIGISSFPDHAEPFHARHGWSKMQSDHRTAEDAIQSAAYRITDIVKRARAKQNPQDRSLLDQQMEQALDKLALDGGQGE